VRRVTKGLSALSDRTPLRTKLITALLTLVIMALAAISVTSDFVLRSYLTTRYDNAVRTFFDAASARPQEILSGYLPGVAYPFNANAVIGIQLDGKPLVPPSGNVPGNGIIGNQQNLAVPSVPATQSWAIANADKLVTVGSSTGRELWRVMTEPITYNDNTPATLVVAFGLGNVNQEIGQLVLVELIVGAAIVVVLAAVGVGVVQANLRSLNDIEMTAGQIAKGHLNHRIPERDPRTEIGSLGHSLNAMLAQIETAFHEREKSEQAAHDSEERMRRFIADASHELRTPLTTIRGFAEYYRQRGGLSSGTVPGSTSGGFGGVVPPGEHGDSPGTAGSPAGLGRADIDRIMQRLESEAARMGLLVEDLLQLARLDQQRPLDLTPVDLLTLSADAVQDARMVASDRPVDLVIGRGAAFIVEGDEQRLRQVIGNLVSNAITHTPAGTAVRVKLSAGTMVPPVPAGGTADAAREEVPAVVLDVEDDGPGMTAEQSRRVFERFYRADAARNRASGGTGLGLAIVAGLVAAHGGTVSVKSAPGEGADFQVKLPLSPDAHLSEDDAIDDDVDVSEDDVNEAAGQ
jgi:two-component system OmpR family sensor kinase